jgi:hypothetical protein
MRADARGREDSTCLLTQKEAQRRRSPLGAPHLEDRPLLLLPRVYRHEAGRPVYVERVCEQEGAPQRHLDLGAPVARQHMGHTAREREGGERKGRWGDGGDGCG